MNLEQFKIANRNNAEIIQQCLEKRTTDFSKIMFWEGVQGKDLSFDELSSKWADILACAAIGAVPVIKKTGTDGYIYYAGSENPVEAETKLCGIRHSDLALGQRGGLYYSANLDNPNSKCAITTHFNGSFDAGMSHETLQTKKRDTFLVLFDRTENKIIDAYGIRATDVLQLLESKKHNATVTLKLSAFQNTGFRMGTMWESEKFYPWQSRMITKTKESRRFIQSW